MASILRTTLGSALVGAWLLLPLAGAHAQDAASVVTLASGLGYVELTEGTGPSPHPGQVVVVHYTGWIEEGCEAGRKFDSSVDSGQPYRFPLGRGRVIKGWDEGVDSMRVGGKRRLVIPPHLGYGARGYPGLIPPDATLIFEVELLGIE